MADLPALRSRGGLQCSNEYILRLASAQGQSENLVRLNFLSNLGNTKWAQQAHERLEFG